LQVIAALALAAGAFTFTAGSAQAQYYRHGGYHGYRYGGSGVYFGFGAPYAYYPQPYYGSACRYERVRYWRYGRWHWRSVRRCY
jgi:hypothetical protein